jgi:ribosome-associated protein
MFTQKEFTVMEAVLEAEALARKIVDLVTDKKGENVVLLDLREVTLFTDFFVIANANSDRQLNAITDNIRDELKKQAQVAPMRVEGRGENGWVLMDYGDVIVHLFTPAIRAYYDLEGHWADASVLVRIQ